MKNKYYYLLLLAVGVFFYILNVQTPFSHDDYAYCFYYDVDSYTIRPTGIRVTGICQMFESMWHHYFCVNGRFVSHTLLQCFCAFWGKDVFNVCNTIVFLLFLNTIVLLSGHKHSVFVVLFVFLVSMCLLPFPGQTMLWMTGSLNYLWTATSTLLYIYWLRKQNHHSSPIIIHVGVFIVCLAIGWTNESVTAPVALGLFLYFLFNRNQFKGIVITSCIGYALGAALIVMGPGTFARVSSGGEIKTQMDTIQFLFLHTYNTMYQYIHTVLPILVVVGFVILCFVRKNRWKSLLQSQYGWIFLSFFLFFLALGMDEDRVYFGVSVFSLLILLEIGESLVSFIVSRWVFSVVMVLLCVFPVRAAWIATNSYMEYDKSVYDEVKRAPKKCVVRARAYEKKNRYVYVTMLDADRYTFHNRVKAFYYGKEYIQALPGDLYDVVINGGPDSMFVATDRYIDGKRLHEFSKYWIIPVDEIVNHRVQFVYTHHINREEKTCKQKLVRYLLNTMDKGYEIRDAYGVQIGVSNYIILPKDNDVVKISYWVRE